MWRYSRGMGRGPEPRHRTALLERTAELAEIARALAAARVGEGSVVVVEGPPGIGKTALLADARDRAVQAGMRALSARGGELEQHFPYGIVRQLFEPLLQRASPDERDHLLSGSAQLAASLVGDAEPTQGSLPDTAFALLHGLYWLTVHAASTAPALITIDDLQWADGPSIRFVLHLARRIEGVPCVVMASARTGEHGGPSPLLDERVLVLRPGPLTQDSVGRLLASGLGGPPAAAFARASYAATGGVPFLVHELVTALSTDGIRATEANADVVDRLGPLTVARATLARLARTPRGCVPLARAVAVLGAEAQTARAARLAGLDEAEVLSALDALVSVNVLEPGEPLRFAHPIVRAAIYDELAAGERSQLHRSAAELLSDDGAELDSVAAQLLASDPIGSSRVIAQLREAARHALERGAPENAVSYLRRALREGGEPSLRAATSLELATAARFAGQWELMTEQLERARRLAQDPLLRHTAALELATVLVLRGEWERPAALLRDALADLGDRGPELAVRLESLLAGIAISDPRLVDEFNRRLPVLEELAVSAGRPARPLSLLLAAVTAWREGDASKVAALVERGWDDGGLLAAAVDRWSLYQGLSALVMCDLLDRATELADVMLEDSRNRGALAAFHLAAAYRSWVDARRGRLDSAESALRAAIEFQHRQQLSYELPACLWLATDVILERPDAEDLAAIAQAVRLGPIAEVHSGAQLLDLRGRIRHAAGQTEAGIADLRQAGEIWGALGMRNPGGANWRSALALMLAAEQRDEARHLAESELDDARRVGRPRAVGVALRALGLLAAGDAGLELLADAERTLAVSPAQLEHARALVELGAALRRAGRRTAAREPLRAGLDSAVACGALRLSERARAELVASGARPRRARSTGPEALTPSELRVARLAAEGRTNNEVAQALFVTPKTVDTHLTHVYAKLEITSRAALVQALRRLG